MPGRKAVFRLEVWNSFLAVGFILLYSLCSREADTRGVHTCVQPEAAAAPLAREATTGINEVGWRPAV